MLRLVKFGQRLHRLDGYYVFSVFYHIHPIISEWSVAPTNSSLMVRNFLIKHSRSLTSFTQCDNSDRWSVSPTPHNHFRCWSLSLMLYQIKSRLCFDRIAMVVFCFVSASYSNRYRSETTARQTPIAQIWQSRGVQILTKRLLHGYMWNMICATWE